MATPEDGVREGCRVPELQSDRVWFITGCSSGFGAALARAALERGERVVATARRPEQLAALVEAHRERARATALDVADAASVEQAVRAGLDAFGRIDVLVNNAGCGLVGAFEESSEQQVRRNFEVNFFGAMAVTRGVLASMRERRSGTIVNMSAAAAISNYAGFGAYGAAKCALEGWSEGLRTEVQPLGLRVMIVQPGPFRTEFVGRSLEKAAGKIAAYDATSGRFASMLTKMDGKQPGNPAGAARAIMAAVDAPIVPQRLVLGKYAVEKTKRMLAARAAELAEWEETGAGADVG